MDLAMALAARARRRPRRRQRPRRRPVRGRRPGPARLADAARRRGRRAARRTTCCARGTHGHLRHLDRLLQPARQDGRRRRPAVRRDAHRLQVDRPGRRAWRSATRRRSATASTPSTCGQGRRLRAAAALRAGRRGQGRGPHPDRPARRHRRASTACTPPTSSRCGSTDLGADRRPRWSGCAAPRRPSLGGLAVRARRRPRAGQRRPAAHRRAALPPRRRRPGDRPPERHRAEAEVLPRGRRARSTPTAGVDAARISAAGRLDALRDDIKAAAGI